MVKYSCGFSIWGDLLSYYIKECVKKGLFLNLQRVAFLVEFLFLTQIFLGLSTLRHEIAQKSLLVLIDEQADVTSKIPSLSSEV